MEYQEFLQTIKDAVSKQIPHEYEVRLNSVIKNNSQKLDAITIIGEGSHIAPNIYLNKYHEEYKNGRGLESITKEILSIFNANQGKTFDTIPDILNFDSITGKITFRLINLEMNKERLTHIPYKVIEDLAKVYYVVVNSNSEGMSTIAVTNDILERWEVDLECIDKLAYENTPYLFPEKLKSMCEVIKEIMLKQYGGLHELSDSSEDKELYEQFISQLTDTPRNKDDTEMYVLSNINGINGASTLLYPGILHNFAIDQQSSFYILPSSIHEVILVPDNGKLTKESLRQMVAEVNNSQVPIEEVLSSEVYYYDLDTDEFHIAKDE